MLHDLAVQYTPACRDVLCIGMGVGVVPMRFAREGARVDVVEINPAVVGLAEEYFGFDASKVNLTIGDGRHFAMTTTNRYDAVVLDAFLGESPPSHLMTREAFAAMKRCLRPDGVLVMNAFGDFTAGQDFLIGSLHKTLQAVFQSVRLHGAETAGTGNVYPVASKLESLEPLRTPDLTAIPTFLQGKARAAFAGSPTLREEAGMILTDDYNPVEFYDAHNRERLRRALASEIQYR
jgi:spermidine synthase